MNYVVLFNILVGPVFSAGSVTSERERETLELLLTTTLSPWQILWAKLVSGLRSVERADDVSGLAAAFGLHMSSRNIGAICPPCCFMC